MPVMAPRSPIDKGAAALGRVWRRTATCSTRPAALRRSGRTRVRTPRERISNAGWPRVDYLKGLRRSLHRPKTDVGDRWSALTSPGPSTRVTAMQRLLSVTHAPRVCSVCALRSSDRPRRSRRLSIGYHGRRGSLLEIPVIPRGKPLADAYKLHPLTTTGIVDLASAEGGASPSRHSSD